MPGRSSSRKGDFNAKTQRRRVAGRFFLNGNRTVPLRLRAFALKTLPDSKYCMGFSNPQWNNLDGEREIDRFGNRKST